MKEIEHITLAIIGGGVGRRMGLPKAWLRIRNESILATALDHLGHRPAVVLGHHYVRGLDIAVDNSLWEGMLQRLADLHKQIEPGHDDQASSNVQSGAPKLALSRCCKCQLARLAAPPFDCLERGRKDCPHRKLTAVLVASRSFCEWGRGCVANVSS